jgi:hypothetical protein
MKKIVSAVLLLASTSIWAQCTNTNLSAWSNFQDNGAVNVTAAAAMDATACGLSIAVKHTQKSFVADTNPAGELRYRAAMYVDPNGISLPSTGQDRRLKFHNAQCVDAGCTSTGIVQFKLENDGVQHSIKGFVKDINSAADKNKFDVPLADGPNRVEYDLDINAGTFKLWVGATSESDTPVVDLSGLDLSGWSNGVGEARIGSVNNPVNVTADQVIYVDEFESRRQTFIGL